MRLALFGLLLCLTAHASADTRVADFFFQSLGPGEAYFVQLKVEGQSDPLVTLFLRAPTNPADPVALQAAEVAYSHAGRLLWRVRPLVGGQLLAWGAWLASPLEGDAAGSEPAELYALDLTPPPPATAAAASGATNPDVEWVTDPRVAGGGYWRTKANSTTADNLSHRGNVNPFTGRPGTKR